MSSGSSKLIVGEKSTKTLMSFLARPWISFAGKKNIPQKGRDISVVYRANVVEIVLDSTKSCTKYFLLGSFGFSHSGTRGYHKSIQLFNIDIFTPQKSKHRYQTWPYFSRSPPFSKAHMCFCCFFFRLRPTRLHHLLVMESLGVLVTIALADFSDSRDTD